MSKQQSTVMTLSTHAEYITAAEASKELIWLQCLLSKLHEDMSQSTPLYIDNRAADLLVQNPVNHAVMKHIDVCCHLICKCIEDKCIDLRLIVLMTWLLICS